MSELEVGIVVEVAGMISKIATFDSSNHVTFINNGEIVKNVSINSFIIIQQGYIKIIGRINAETIWDSQNNLKNYHLDNRFLKNSIRRILDVQTIGYISKGRFYVGSAYFPMIGNICLIPTSNEVMQIYLNSFENGTDDISILVGKSTNEQNDINLPVNLFFASHIGIFGNTGSGKSNTLHKLFFELFKLPLENLKKKSKFVVLDFNGEYVHENSFGVSDIAEKLIYDLSTRHDSANKYPVTINTFYDDEILSILFQATSQTQKPFLSRVVKGQKKYGTGMESVSKWVVFLIKRILQSDPNIDLKNRLADIIGSGIPSSTRALENLRSVIIQQQRGFAYINSPGNWTFFNGEWTEKQSNSIGLDIIQQIISLTDLNSFQEFELRCKLQLVNDLLYRNVISEHIDPLIKRIETRTLNMSKYLLLVDSTEDTRFLEIISLRKLNHEAKQVMAMLISKMYFDSHKLDKKWESFHLIIDEAHNILSSQSISENDAWRDYRLSTFEEIIKEGRKFGFFLTLASQRPADISPTLLSQVHNFFLHKLVNEKDLQIVDNSISTLDKISKSMLPTLSQGVCIVSGTATSLPLLVTIDFINDIKLRPQSDTINLIDYWK